MDAHALYGSPNALAAHYSRFQVADRLLLTGHSHQAWPDRALDGQMEAFQDAAQHIDDKWGRAFAKAERVARSFAALVGDPGADIALAASTHELVFRWLSALPLRERPRVVTTDGEFHSVRRQLDRLAEDGLEVVRVPADPAADVAARLAAAVDERTSAVMVSAVFYHSAHIVPGLGELMEACRRHGVELLVDVYHALNVLPWSLRGEGLDGAYVVGGGYKYLQLGEGNCFLRLPPGCTLRPRYTGWFAEFGDLERKREGQRVSYANGGGRFAGATYDPTSHYRAAAVFDFFEEQDLTPALLREVSQHQVGLLAASFDALDLDPHVATRDRAVPLERVGGFLVLRSDRAEELAAAIRARGVSIDRRGDRLRLGPAPYLSGDQIRSAMERIGEAARSVG